MPDRLSALVTFLLHVLRLTSLLAPSEDRCVWLREWSAEVLHTTTRPLSRLRLIGWVSGAPIDALLLRASRWGLGQLRCGWWSDVRDGGRALRKAPLQSATIVLCLAIGGTITVVVFGVINAMLGGALPGIRDRSELVRLKIERPDGRKDSPRVADARVMPATAPGLAGWGVEIGAKPFSVSAGDQGGIAHGAFVSGTYFGVLGTRPVIGRLLGPGDDRPDAPPVAVIGYHFWQRRFGGRDDAIGRIIQVTTGTYQVVGVTPAGFTGIAPAAADEPTSDRGDIWLPMSEAPRIGFGVDNPVSNAAVIARLERDVTRDEAESRLQPLVVRFNAARQASTTRPLSASSSATAVRLTPLNFLPGDEDEQLTSALMVAAVAAVPLIILGIGCANVAGIQLARAIGRTHELAVRVSLGADRIRVVRLLAIETGLLAVTAATIGWFSARYLLRLAGPVLPVAPIADLRLLLLTTAVPMGVTLVAGLLPAWRATGFDVTSGLRLGPRVGRQASPRMRRAIVALQVGLSFALLIAGGTLVRAVSALPAAVGPAPDDVLMAEVRFWDLGWEGTRELQARRTLIDSVRSLPGVEAIGFSPRSVFLPVSRGGDGRCQAGHASGLTRLVSPAFFDVLRLPMTQGRALRPGDGVEAVVVNEAFVRRLENPASAVGSAVTISLGDGVAATATVVGVVADNYERFPTGSPRPLCWPPWNVDGASAGVAEAGGTGTGYVTLFIRSRQAGELAPAIRRMLRDIDPRLAPAEMGTMAELMPLHHRVLHGIATALSAASLIALGLAAVGLFGVIAYGAAQRRHEFGVRLALGARPSDIARVLLAESVVVVLAGAVGGIALASPAVWILSQGLTTVRLADPVLAAVTLATLLAVSVSAAARPIYRTTRIDPVTALRSE